MSSKYINLLAFKVEKKEREERIIEEWRHWKVTVQNSLWFDFWNKHCEEGGRDWQNING